MANPEHLARLKQGPLEFNTWREINPLVEVDLAGVKLQGADLTERNLAAANLSEASLDSANLSAADLSGANLSKAEVSGANLSFANLTRANLQGTSLNGAHLTLTNLSHANLANADLKMAMFVRADLSQADLSGVKLWQTVIGDCDLTAAGGLDLCNHMGPSILDFGTITRSGGLSVPFLRGCGLPDNLIDFLPSLLNQPIQFDSCFISYSTKDQDFAERLYADLQSRGVRCWFAPHDIAGGKKIYEQIDAAIQVYDRLLLILSDHSMKSSWVETEISKARKREVRDARRMLFPVRLVEFQTLQDWERFDADTGKDSAREIREYFIPDFSNWKNHDSYKKAFDRLIRDLQAPTSAIKT